MCRLHCASLLAMSILLWLGWGGQAVYSLAAFPVLLSLWRSFHRSAVFRSFSPALDLGKMAIFKQERAGRCLPCPTRSHSIKCVFSGSTQESASFVPRDRFFSERMEESPQIITLNYMKRHSSCRRMLVTRTKKWMSTRIMKRNRTMNLSD